MNRTRAIAAAALAALLTGTMLFLYVSKAQDRAASAEQPVSVLVAKASLALGASFDDAYNNGGIGQVKMPKRLVPPTAVLNPTALAGKVATGPIAVGQTLVQESFASAEEVNAKGGTSSLLSKRIPADRVAVTFSAGASAAVAGLIQPGDHVNMLIQVPDAAAVGLPTSNGPAVVHVFQDLEVFALGTTPTVDPRAAAAVDPKTGAAAPPVQVTGSLYTVLVDPKDAARLILLTTQYPVTLSLVNPDYKAKGLPPVSGKDAMPKGLTPDESAGKN